LKINSIVEEKMIWLKTKFWYDLSIDTLKLYHIKDVVVKSLNTVL
jgi:hypothetical protein